MAIQSVLVHEHLRQVKPDETDFLGRIRICVLPGHWDEEMFRFWWPRISARERERMAVDEVRNLITTAGRTEILTFIGAAAGNSHVFSQYFAVGTANLAVVNPNDTVVAGESLRLVPTTATVSGNTVDISTFFSGSQANGVLTNCGIFGISATSSSGTGTLLTHALLNGYNKQSGTAVTFDYLITLN